MQTYFVMPYIMIKYLSTLISWRYMKYYKTSNDKLTLRQSTQPVCTTCKLYTSKAAIA